MEFWEKSLSWDWFWLCISVILREFLNFSGPQVLINKRRDWGSDVSGYFARKNYFIVKTYRENIKTQ